jgi:hypothetical protein
MVAFPGSGGFAIQANGCRGARSYGPKFAKCWPGIAAALAIKPAADLTISRPAPNVPTSTYPVHRPRGSGETERGGSVSARVSTPVKASRQGPFWLTRL